MSRIAAAESASPGGLLKAIHHRAAFVVGAAIGGLVGWAVPYLFHSRKDGEPGAPGSLPAGSPSPSDDSAD